MRQQRAELILDVAEELFAKKGYHDTSMDEIAIHAGIAKGTLYQHFARKVDLACALFERSITLFEQAVERISVSPLGTRARLEAILSFIYQQRGSSHMQLIQLASTNGEIYRGLQEKKEMLYERLRRTKARIQVMFEEGKTEGLFDPTISTELMTRLFWHMLSLSRREPLGSLEQLSVEEGVAQISRLFFEGTMRRKP
ncbi:TetR/AcrR family transcriptional regulator [Ktedonobacter robiniae]|uniref:TetR/AcrR family transcriptional regulator n=1 Tax=Ktedonobacter robiniae TaxID=2778365 RepID=UPI001915DDE8|nr:TetR/AcrR family transcriptional regulator [Ktedonobacter robiniae]